MVVLGLSSPTTRNMDQSSMLLSLLYSTSRILSPSFLVSGSAQSSYPCRPSTKRVLVDQQHLAAQGCTMAQESMRWTQEVVKGGTREQKISKFSSSGEISL